MEATLERRRASQGDLAQGAKHFVPELGRREPEPEPLLRKELVDVGECFLRFARPRARFAEPGSPESLGTRQRLHLPWKPALERLGRDDPRIEKRVCIL